jgi:hypothetical protein
MPNTYKSFALNLTTNTVTNIYTVPVGRTVILKSFYVANVSTLSDTVEICMRKSGAGADVFLLKGASIGVATTMQAAIDSIVLEVGDILKVKAGTANRLDIVVSFLEIS